VSEDAIAELEFNCSVCKKPSIFDKEITYVGKVGSTQVQLCDSCSKNNDNMVLKTMYDRNLESELKTLLDKMIKRGENNSNVGSFVSRCKFRYGHDRQNPFCNEPLNYVWQTDLTEE
jgi:Lhr-like helicase